jgi:pimeloyl-ACP methyl ester carboxylesterase
MRRAIASFAVLLSLIATPAASLYAQAQGASPVASPRAGIVESSVTVGGRSLHVACAGTGGPTVLFEPGGPFIDGGTALVFDLGADLAAALGTRFCSYDRAGTGQSDPDPMGVRTFQEDAADLHAVLASPDLACPCVVIGESLGGSIALVALAEDAAGFGGLVLLDAPYPGYLDVFLALAPAGSSEATFGTDPYNTGENEERLDVATGFRQVTVPARAPAIPIVVVTHGAGYPPPCNWDPPCSARFPADELEATWQAGQKALAEALGARLVVAENTTHTIANENPGLVIGLAGEVIAAVRDPSTWATPVASPTA